MPNEPSEEGKRKRELTMIMSRDRVFYRTNTAVKEGDEFCQIVLKHFPNMKEQSFRVEVFHGLAGTPPKEPESAHHFDAEEKAYHKIEQTVAEIERQGFRLYSPTLHGVRNFESC
jgi:hypothetical protein